MASNYTPLTEILRTTPVPSELSLDERVQRCLQVTENGGELIKDVTELRQLLAEVKLAVGLHYYEAIEPYSRIQLVKY